MDPLGPSWDALRRSWPPLWCSWDATGSSYSALGCFLDTPGSFLGRSWALVPPSRALLEHPFDVLLHPDSLRDPSGSISDSADSTDPSRNWTFQHRTSPCVLPGVWRWRSASTIDFGPIWMNPGCELIKQGAQNGPTYLARRYARSDPPPPACRGHGVLDTKCKFLSISAKSQISKIQNSKIFKFWPRS